MKDVCVGLLCAFAFPLLLLADSDEQREANLAVTGSLESAAESSQLMSLETFRAFAQGKSAIIVDSRDDVLYQRGHVPGAISLPLRRFLPAYEKLRSFLEADRHREIVVYCSGGGCNSSEEVKNKLLALGYTRVRAFSGGWAVWQEAKLPEEKSEVGVNVAIRRWRNPVLVQAQSQP